MWPPPHEPNVKTPPLPSPLLRWIPGEERERKPEGVLGSWVQSAKVLSGNSFPALSSEGEEGRNYYDRTKTRVQFNLLQFKLNRSKIFCALCALLWQS
jgi:hypothetical protein